ncbi:MAG: hypothetical protein KDK59_07400, partial [Simkania sp.]|nr:hypothetical protein [Simkania sp.]
MIKNSLEYVVQPALVLGAAYLMGNSVAQRNFAYKVAVAGLLGKHLIVSSSSQNRQQANQMATTSIFAEAFFLSFLSIASAQVAKRSASMFEWSLTKSGAICSAQWATSFALSKIKIQRERPLPENLPDFFTADTQYDHQGRPVIPQGLTLKNAIEAVEILAGSQANKGFITSLFLKDQNSLRDWLFRMKDCKDFQTNTEAICQHIISFFNEADKNPTFRDSFLETIEEAASTCGDRVSLSLIYVGIKHSLTQIDHRNLKALAEF